MSRRLIPVVGGIVVYVLIMMVAPELNDQTCVAASDASYGGLIKLIALCWMV